MDTAGKFRVAFFRKNRYYSVFICAKTGRKLYFPHKKEISFSAGISQICRACRVFPKVLVADRAGKILSKRLGSLLSAKLVKLTPVATDDLFEMVARRSSSRYRLHYDLLDGRSRFAERVLGRGGRAC